jgi:hypothetical protein
MNVFALVSAFCIVLYLSVAPPRLCAQNQSSAATTATVETSSPAEAQSDDSTASSLGEASSATVITSSTSSATHTVKEISTRSVASKALRIFLESRNVIARPEGYETLLTIEEDGQMRFEFHTVSGRRDSIITKLKPRELQTLKKALNFPKFLESQPVQRLVYADWMQSLTVEKDGKSKNIRFMVDVQKKTPENIDKHIQEQFGEAMTRDVWQFVQLIRAINARFRF